MTDLEIQEQAEKMYKSIDQSQLGATFMYAERTAFVKGAKWMQEQDEWISVEHRLPANLSEVNVLLKSGYITSLNYGESSGFFNAMSNVSVSVNNPVIKWMPLPSPPKTK